MINFFSFNCPALFAKKKIAFTFASLCQKGNANEDDSVAQLVEHIPFKDGVLGPNPNWVTTLISNIPKST